MTTKKKKSAKQKRILIVAVIVAIAIVAGSTFAWFSSKDEVTNRLSSSVDYNVAIAEDFQSPSNWMPGQTINKDVSAVNTGNVDAFVRMWLGGTMRLLTETTGADVTADLPSLTKVTDEKKTNLGLNYYDADTNKYFKTLSTEKINNPQDRESLSNLGANVDEETNQPAEFSEVQAMQAAGVLVYAPENAKYTWTLEQNSEMKVGSFENNAVEHLTKGTVVGTAGSGADKVLAGSSADDPNYYGKIDASTFVPQTTGLYLFRRNVGETADGTANKYEYSGYYYVSNLDGGTYFALYTGEGDNGYSDYVLPSGSVNDNSTAVPSLDQVLPVKVSANKVFLMAATEQLLNTDQLEWTFNKFSNPPRFDVRYTNGDKPIIIHIALANLGQESEQWTAISDNSNAPKDILTTFYYNNDVEAGDTTTKLIDSVTLDGASAVNGSYLAFDFDLNVFMDSVQVTFDDAGNESYDSVQPWAATNGKNVAANGGDFAGRTDETEIKQIRWGAVSSNTSSDEP